MAHRNQKEGFTIVELLVVITIIGMLVAILVPAINYAIESGRRIKCLHNAKSITTALINYQTTKRKMPKATGNFGERNWVVMIFDELGRRDLYENAAAAAGNRSVELLLCPSDDEVEVRAAGLSYLANDRIIRTDRAVSLSEVSNLSNTILIAEDIEAGQNWDGGTITFTMPANGQIDAVLESRHGGEIIVAFCDGSGKQIPKNTDVGAFDPGPGP